MQNINLDFVGLFLLMVGYVIGLGAVTVIDLHGFLGRKSSYWTEATTRTHKVTKPMIWVGTTLAIIGGVIFFRSYPYEGLPFYLSIAALVMIINGIFLSFSVSPYMLQREKEGRQADLLPQSWQTKIMISLIFSDLFWWGSLLLLTYHLASRLGIVNTFV